MAELNGVGPDGAPVSGVPAAADRPTDRPDVHRDDRTDDPGEDRTDVHADDLEPATGSEPVTAADLVAARWRRLVQRLADDPGRVAEALVSLASVVLATALILRTLHPDLLWANTTPTGGDMGAHVWGPRYLLDHLLPQGRLSGWTPDWYNGFPAYQFYMVIPSLLIVILHVGLAWYGTVAVALAGTFATAQAFVRPRLRPYRHLVLAAAVLATVLATSIPYNRAFKLVTALGLLGLPLACWAFAKLADLPFPAPPLAAGAALLFAYNREPLYNDTGNIIGGNFHSTMAGEFAFSISLTLSVLYLGRRPQRLRAGPAPQWPPSGPVPARR